MNREEIMTILPHREGMLLLDEAERDGDTAHGKYRVRGDEWFLRGHFQGNPVVPGVIQCKILAQSACVLLSDKITANSTPMYTGLDGVRFKSPVRPGDLFETTCRITRAKPPFYYAEGEGTVNGKLCVKAEFSFAIVGK
jgi:3-hydroxyacyl-[acyl-carrier-protein] dehydratase